MPCKLRLVALAGALRARLAAAPGTAKVVVFVSNCDSVEFYHAGGDCLILLLKIMLLGHGYSALQACR